jgi:hypothetical protein
MFKYIRNKITPSNSEIPLSKNINSDIEVKRNECEIIKKDSFYNFIKSDIRTYRI